MQTLDSDNKVAIITFVKKNFGAFKNKYVDLQISMYLPVNSRVAYLNTSHSVEIYLYVF